jgi:hypothetical protein
MRRLGASLVGIVAAVAVSGCTTQFKDITVETVVDPKVQLNGYESYTWAAAAAVIRDPYQEWTPADLDLGAEIRFLVDRELRAQGYTEVVSAPELLAIYAVGVDMMSLNITVNEENETRFEEVPKGGLVVILADADTRSVIWAGAAEADLLEKPDRELTKQRLDHAISKMFKKFPN